MQDACCRLAAGRSPARRNGVHAIIRHPIHGPRQLAFAPWLSRKETGHEHFHFNQPGKSNATRRWHLICSWWRGVGRCERARRAASGQR